MILGMTIYKLYIVICIELSLSIPYNFLPVSIF
jgi:hypothetical protein